MWQCAVVFTMLHIEHTGVHYHYNRGLLIHCVVASQFFLLTFYRPAHGGARAFSKPTSSEWVPCLSVLMLPHGKTTNLVL